MCCGSQSSAVGQDRHIPILDFGAVEALVDATPSEARLICVELDAASRALHAFTHPDQAVYLLGAGDRGLPDSTLESHPVLEVPGD